jgi:hypothetical protein
MTRKIQVSFAHTQLVTTAQRPGSPESVGTAVIIDVDLIGESFRSGRAPGRRKSQVFPHRRSAGRPSPQQPRRQPKPPCFPKPSFRVGPAAGRDVPRAVISLRTGPHTVCIFYRHVL